MPRRQELSTILALGSGPIVTGQACNLVTVEAVVALALPLFRNRPRADDDEPSEVRG
jgi:hypothetical protein